MAPSRTPNAVHVKARSFAVEQAQAQLKHLTVQISRGVKSCSAGAVHDVRVAIRRFTRAVAVCRPYFHAADLRKNRKRLKKIMTEAGDVRNCDIALKFIVRFRVPQAPALRSKLRSRRTELARLLVADLRKWRERGSSVKWRATLKSPATPAKDLGEEPSQEMAHRLLMRGVKDFLRQGDRASSSQASPKELHHFRIFAKKFRYSLELLQPLYGSSLDPMVANIKHVSALLGDINDCVTAVEIFSEYKGGQRLVDRLKKRQHKKTEEFRKYWKEFSRGEQAKSVEPQELKKPVANAATRSSRRESAA
ncbi:MAG TPA: CHAD domain-containing protein [Bryobacteraceae bacterium]|jgi:CHAD domain-containing protein|nr:CHAD domain-containing protein [Bryobacteraceae bacterium]